MAEDDWRRRREREDEQDREREEELARKRGETGRFTGRPGDVPAEKFDELIERAEPMIEQLNSLYNMFAVGVERQPPVVRRKQLDQIMVALQLIGKPTQSALFRYNGLYSRYQVHCERWDRLVKRVESGQIKRVAGPKRGPGQK